MGTTHLEIPAGPYKLLVELSETGIASLLIESPDYPGVRSDADSSPVDTGLAERVRAQLIEYFAGTRKVFDLPLDLQGTEFRRRVWRKLCAVPYGVTITYGALAARAGNPGAARAVGSAMATNPVPIIVPCHRVVAAGGRLGGYTGGLDIKRYLLRLEGLDV
ncbi:methylated-DNA--[protein]-cysteine S-methyltransferase [bacterium]|nr:methylated-DNA--[protein]-cysteine S-methyltransferase [candidate division CSSED10-310 bacterium]